MSDTISRLTDILSTLERDQALRNKISYLERELARKPKEVQIPCDHEAHIEKLRARIKELEKENQRLSSKIEAIRART